MEKGHPKRQLPSIRAERGTLRADRGDFDFVERPIFGFPDQSQYFCAQIGAFLWVRHRQARLRCSPLRFQRDLCFLTASGLGQSCTDESAMFDPGDFSGRIF